MKKNVREHIQILSDKGFCYIPDGLSSVEIDLINTELAEYVRTNTEGIVYETDNQTIRAINGPHLFASFFHKLSGLPDLVDIAKQYLQEPVYVHQFKINMKQGLTGEVWPWHQDFVFWREFDHIEQPKMLSIAIALDDISMLSGPLVFIPGSHKLGELCTLTVNENGWRNHVASDLSFQIDKQTLKRIIDIYGVEYIVANKGDLFLFDPQVAHCSGNNLSPLDRRLMIITYNAVSNAPRQPSKRPEFLCSSNVLPIS